MKKLFIIMVLSLLLLSSAIQVYAQEDITLTFWNGFTAADGDQMRKIVREWNDNNPNIEIEMQIIEWGTFYDKFTSSLAAGRGPDIAILHQFRMAYYFDKNLLLPLDDLVKEFGLNDVDFVESPWDVGIYEGHRYSLPLDWMPFIGLYYNKDHYEEAGLDPNSPPENREEFIEYNQKLKTEDKWGYMISRTTPLERLFLSIMYQNGTTLLNEDFTETNINSSAGIDAAQFLYDVVHEYEIAPMETAPDEETAAFKSRKVTHVLHHLAMSNDFSTQEDLNFEYAPIPVFGEQQAVFGNTHQFVLPRKNDNSSEKTEAAMKFITWLLTEKQMTWAKGGQLPVHEETLNSSELKELPFHQSQISVAPYVQYPPLLPEYMEAFDRIRPALQRIILDRQTPEESLNQAAEEINKILEG